VPLFIEGSDQVDNSPQSGSTKVINWADLIMEVWHIRGCNYQMDRKEVLDHEASWHLKLDKNLKESVLDVPITSLCGAVCACHWAFPVQHARMWMSLAAPSGCWRGHQGDTISNMWHTVLCTWNISIPTGTSKQIHGNQSFNKCASVVPFLWWFLSVYLEIQFWGIHVTERSM
jgi:hypothetical protein